MDRMDFSQAAGFQSLKTVMKQYYPEINMMYNLVDADKHVVRGHLNKETISFTVYCDKDTAVQISNRIQDRGPLELNGELRDIEYNIKKDGIDLEFKVHHDV